MSKVLITESNLTNIANAIRSKTGKSATLTPAQMVTEINGISVGTDVSDTTAAAANVLTGKYFYTSSGVKTQGTITTYNGEHHSLGYRVSITLSSEFYASSTSCTIWQINSTSSTDEYGYYDDLTQLGEILDPDGSTTVIVSDTAFCLWLEFNSSGMGATVGNTTTTGGVTKYASYPSCPPYPNSGYDNLYFSIASTGTISCTNIDWDDD